jgi:microcystin-dependent protein
MMLKRFTVALAALFLAGPAYASGTIPFSLSQQLDQFGKPLSGCKLYTIQAGTVATPQNAYQDSALTIPLPNPQICDSAGRLPQMFLADGTIKVRLADFNGVTQVVADNIQVIGASSGGGGGGTVDPTTIIATGDLKARYGVGILSGFVRANGRTIGSSTSGATERANADCDALFEYLWNTDPNLVVSGGRGVSSAADWAANKTIALPDWRGRAIAGLDDMGNSVAGRLTVAGFGPNAINLGTGGGAENRTLLTANLPPYTPSGLISSTPSTGSNNIMSNPGSASSGTAGGTQAVFPIAGTITAPLTVSSSFNGSAQGGTSTPLATVQPTMLTTIYIKL